MKEKITKTLILLLLNT